MWGFLLGMVRDRHLADDLLQETFCRAWQARSKYREVGQERAYLLRIADRLARDRLRAARRRGLGLLAVEDPHEPPDPASESPWESVSQQETEHALRVALESLSDAQRRTLLLRYYGNLSFDEIASELACPLGTVLSHCRRALATLRRLLVEQSS